MKQLTGLFGLLLIVAGVAFGYAFTGLFDNEFIDVAMNETIELELAEDTGYYLLYNNVLPTNRFIVSESTIYSVIEFDVYAVVGDYQLFANLRNVDNGDRVYLEGYRPNTTVQINNMDSLGQYDIPAGSYQFTITPATLDAQSIQSEFEFTLAPTSFVRNLLIVIFSGMGVVVFFVLFLVFFAKQRAKMQQSQEFNGQYQQPDRSNHLFEMDNDDIFDQFDNRR